ncbi:MAG: hypothetical protein VX733_06105 [Candidatus Latescibacterota bacterium]|nr:hypothetical protein [Candidatus Latescibacterota bacterium]
MADIAYRSWSLVPLDRDPTEGRSTLASPPQMANVALDPGGSLVFELADPSSSTLEISLCTTALSAETRQSVLVYTANGVENFVCLPTSEWTATQDEMNMTFTTTASGARGTMKLHLPEGPALIVIGVAFASL